MLAAAEEVEALLQLPAALRRRVQEVHVADRDLLPLADLPQSAQLDPAGGGKTRWSGTPTCLGGKQEVDSPPLGVERCAGGRLAATDGTRRVRTATPSRVGPPRDQEQHSSTPKPVKPGVAPALWCHQSSSSSSSSSAYLPWLRTTLQLGQQSWLTRPRLGNSPTPTACRPLWLLSVNPLVLICGGGAGTR